MERILTFAEFAKNFDQKGTELGNSPADVEALAKSTDQFTTGPDKECPDSPDVVDGGGEKVVALTVKANGNDEGEEEMITDDSEENDDFDNGSPEEEFEGEDDFDNEEA